MLLSKNSLKRVYKMQQIKSQLSTKTMHMETKSGEKKYLRMMRNER
jgi:uncharacterized protein (DUF3084 family)